MLIILFRVCSLSYDEPHVCLAIAVVEPPKIESFNARRINQSTCVIYMIRLELPLLLLPAQ